MPEEKSYLKAAPEDMKWWLDAKFGMFIHWGPASLCGGDISWCRQSPGGRRGDSQTVQPPKLPAEVYDKLYLKFKAEKFDASTWARTAKAAGMKYMVLTTKHHDGFCLFDSRYTDFKSTAPDCPCQRDIVREFADACRAEGLKVGFYYSARDWRHPDYLTENHGRYLAYYHSQLLELLCNYGKVDLLWFDHIGGAHENWDPELVFKMARRLQPGILINDRLHASASHGRLPGGEYEGDYDTPEQKLGEFRLDRPWESCLCLASKVWSYKPGGEIMSLEECVRSLAGCVSGGGNLLLNNGPMPDGRIEPAQDERLREIGKWLERNGEAIYGVRGGPLKNGERGGCVHKGDVFYLHLFDVDAAKLDGFEKQVAKASLLDGTRLELSQEGAALKLKVPKAKRDPFDTVVKLEFKA